MIKYLGSKRTLLPHILRVVAAVAPPERPVTILDLFSGTSRVGHALKRAGFRVVANDHNAYAHTLARCYIEADREDALNDATALVAEMNAIASGISPRVSPGENAPESPAGTNGDAAQYFTRTFCTDARFFHPDNGRRIDALRDEIVRKSLPPVLEAVLLTSLMEAADRVDSTTGVQMAYLKRWAPRALNPLHLRVPDLLPRAAAGKGSAHCLDALLAAETLDADIAYIDPPYNAHSYLGNYHIWETLVRWDRPAAYGTARKRADCATRKSPFNSRRAHAAAFAELIAAVRAPILIVSFNDEGFLSRDEIESVLSRRGRVVTLAHDYPRYVGAKIGIHNPRGEKVGTVGRLRNTEYLAVVVPPHTPATFADSLLPSGNAGLRPAVPAP